MELYVCMLCIRTKYGSKWIAVTGTCAPPFQYDQNMGLCSHKEFKFQNCGEYGGPWSYQGVASVGGFGDSASHPRLTSGPFFNISDSGGWLWSRAGPRPSSVLKGTAPTTAYTAISLLSWNIYSKLFWRLRLAVTPCSSLYKRILMAWNRSRSFSLFFVKNLIFGIQK